MSQYPDNGYQIVCAPGEKSYFCNPDVGSPNLFTGKLEISNPRYRPTLWVGALFLAIFVLSTFAHTYQAIRRRMWWCMGTFVICGVAEIIGWAGRLWMHLSWEWTPTFGGQYVFNGSGFLIQISTLIFGPAFWTAGAYITLGQIMKIRGTFYSRLRPKTYTILFICGDALSIVVQAIGGGLASAAIDEAGAENGAKIMVGGDFHTASHDDRLLLDPPRVHHPLAHKSTRAPMVPIRVDALLRSPALAQQNAPADAFDPQPAAGTDNIPLQSSNASAIEKGHAVGQDGVQYNKRKINILLGALAFCTVLIFVRSVFRAIELLDGWSGALIADQALFNILDGLMVALAMVIMNFAHPGHLLPRQAR